METTIDSQSVEDGKLKLPNNYFDVFDTMNTIDSASTCSIDEFFDTSDELDIEDDQVFDAFEEINDDDYSSTLNMNSTSFNWFFNLHK